MCPVLLLLPRTSGDSLPWCTTPLAAKSSLRPDFHHPIISLFESTLVEQNLVEVGELEAQVDDSFQGADQALKQNRFSKTTQADALKTRRSGSKK